MGRRHPSREDYGPILQRRLQSFGWHGLLRRTVPDKTYACRSPEKVANRFLIRILFEQTDVYISDVLLDVNILLDIIRNFGIIKLVDKLGIVDGIHETGLRDGYDVHTLLNVFTISYRTVLRSQGMIEIFDELQVEW